MADQVRIITKRIIGSIGSLLLSDLNLPFHENTPIDTEGVEVADFQTQGWTERESFR